jgi:uncharacterized protein involved in outer membrane biogenesis
MRISTILKIVGVLVVAVVVAIAAIVLTIDPNDYKDDIQQAAKDATGRDLAIEGDIGLELGLTVGLSIDGVRFANASWGSQPDMLRAKEVAVRVAILPLISGALDVKGLTIRDADILFETDAQGRSNTDFSQPGAAQPAAGAPAPSGGSAGAQVSIAINNVVIENATVTVRNAKTKSETLLVVSRLNASGLGADAPLDIDLAAELTLDGNKLPLSLPGTVGAPAVLMAGNRPFPIDLSGKALGFDFKAKGSINEPKTMSGIALALDASAADLSGLRPFAGDALPTAKPFSFKGSVTGGGKTFAVDGMALKLGATEIGGALQASLAGPRPRLAGKLVAPKIDLTERMPPKQEGAAAGGGAPAAGSGSGGGARPDKVFPNDPLPLDGLKAADAKLSLAVVELIAPGATLTDLSADLALDNGNLAITPFGFALSGSRFDGNVSLAARSAPAKLALALKAPALDMGRMLKEQADIELLRGNAAIDVDVAGSGNSVAAIMASLNGHSRMLMKEGQAKTESFDLIVGGLSSVMGSLFSSKSEWTVLNCMASDFQIEKGVAKSRVNLIDTELLTISADGQVDLGQETLAMKVTPAPKSTTINVSVPIKIGGTLANPTFAPDELATVKKLGGILGLAVFPPAAIVGLTEMGGSDNECVKLAQEGGKAPAQQGDSAPSSVEQIVKEPEKALEGVGKGIQNLFGR